MMGGKDAHNRRWDEVLSQVLSEVARIRIGRTSPVDLDLLFLIPGRYHTPDFEGVRVRGYSKAINAITGKIAFPRDEPKDVRGYIIGCLAQAVDQAEKLAVRRKLAPDLAEIRGVVDELAALGGDSEE